MSGNIGVRFKALSDMVRRLFWNSSRPTSAKSVSLAGVTERILQSEDGEQWHVCGFERILAMCPHRFFLDQLSSNSAEDNDRNEASFRVGRSNRRNSQFQAVTRSASLYSQTRQQPTNARSVNNVSFISDASKVDAKLTSHTSASQLKKVSSRTWIQESLRGTYSSYSIFFGWNLMIWNRWQAFHQIETLPRTPAVLHWPWACWHSRVMSKKYLAIVAVQDRFLSLHLVCAWLQGSTGCQECQRSAIDCDQKSVRFSTEDRNSDEYLTDHDANGVSTSDQWNHLQSKIWRWIEIILFHFSRSIFSLIFFLL